MTRPTTYERINRCAEVARIVLDMQAGKYISTAEAHERLRLTTTNAGRVMRQLREIVPAPVHVVHVGMVTAFDLSRMEWAMLNRMLVQAGHPVRPDEFAAAMGYETACGMGPLVRVHIAHMRAKGVPIHTARSQGPAGYTVVYDELVAAYQERKEAQR